MTQERYFLSPAETTPDIELSPLGEKLAALEVRPGSRFWQWLQRTNGSKEKYIKLLQQSTGIREQDILQLKKLEWLQRLFNQNRLKTLDEVYLFIQHYQPDWEQKLEKPRARNIKAKVKQLLTAAPSRITQFEQGELTLRELINPTAVDAEPPANVQLDDTTKQIISQHPLALQPTEQEPEFPQGTLVVCELSPISRKRLDEIVTADAAIKEILKTHDFPLKSGDQIWFVNTQATDETTLTLGQHSSDRQQKRDILGTVQTNTQTGTVLLALHSTVLSEAGLLALTQRIQALAVKNQVEVPLEGVQTTLTLLDFGYLQIHHAEGETVTVISSTESTTGQPAQEPTNSELRKINPHDRVIIHSDSSVVMVRIVDTSSDRFKQRIEVKATEAQQSPWLRRYIAFVESLRTIPDFNTELLTLATEFIKHAEQQSDRYVSTYAQISTKLKQDIKEEVDRNSENAEQPSLKLIKMVELFDILRGFSPGGWMYAPVFARMIRQHQAASTTEWQQLLAQLQRPRDFQQLLQQLQQQESSAVAGTTEAWLEHQMSSATSHFSLGTLVNALVSDLPPGQQVDAYHQLLKELYLLKANVLRGEQLSFEELQKKLADSLERFQENEEPLPTLPKHLTRFIYSEVVESEQGFALLFEHLVELVLKQSPETKVTDIAAENKERPALQYDPAQQMISLKYDLIGLLNTNNDHALAAVMQASNFNAEAWQEMHILIPDTETALSEILTTKDLGKSSLFHRFAIAEFNYLKQQILEETNDLKVQEPIKSIYRSLNPEQAEINLRALAGWLRVSGATLPQLQSIITNLESKDPTLVQNLYARCVQRLIANKTIFWRDTHGWGGNCAVDRPFIRAIADAVGRPNDLLAIGNSDKGSESRGFSLAIQGKTKRMEVFPDHKLLIQAAEYYARLAGATDLIDRVTGIRRNLVAIGHSMGGLQQIYAELCAAGWDGFSDEALEVISILLAPVLSALNGIALLGGNGEADDAPASPLLRASGKAVKALTGEETTPRKAVLKFGNALPINKNILRLFVQGIHPERQKIHEASLLEKFIYFCTAVLKASRPLTTEELQLLKNRLEQHSARMVLYRGDMILPINHQLQNLEPNSSPISSFLSVTTQEDALHIPPTARITILEGNTSHYGNVLGETTPEKIWITTIASLLKQIMQKRAEHKPS